MCSIDIHLILCLALTRDIADKLFSNSHVVDKIIINIIALSLSCGYSFSSDTQSRDNGKLLCLDINVGTQESSSSDSVPVVLRLHESLFSVRVNDTKVSLAWISIF